LGAVRKDSHLCSRAFFTERPRKPIPPDRYGLFHELPEAGAIPNLEGSTVAETLVPNFPFGVSRELHNEQCRNFGSRLIQLGFASCGIGQTHHAFTHEIGRVVELYVQTVEEHVRSHRIRGTGTRIPIFLLAYRVLRHYGLDTSYLNVRMTTPTALRTAVWDTLDKKRPKIDQAENLMNHLHDIQNYARQHIVAYLRIVTS
jgi:hypothetical protein